MKDTMHRELVKLSKFLSLVLRHSPQTIHLNMDTQGWAALDVLIRNAKKYKNIALTIDVIHNIVAHNDKQRFIISDDGKRIRANQGHSIPVDLGLERREPPGVLFHGTASRFLGSIMQDGIKPMRRQYVHLSLTAEIALSVGKRHGNPVVLYIDAKKMHEDGFAFYLSENKVWLTDVVPVQYIQF